MASPSDLRLLSLTRRSAKFEYAFFDSADAAAEMRALMDRDDDWCLASFSQATIFSEVCLSGEKVRI